MACGKAQRFQQSRAFTAQLCAASAVAAVAAIVGPPGPAGAATLPLAALTGSGHSIGVVAAASYGPAKGSWVIHYADGTADTVALSTPDWSATPPAGSTRIASMTYHNSSTAGHTVRGTYVFAQTLPVDPAKTVVAVTLPTISATAIRGAAALHVFDLTLN